MRTRWKFLILMIITALLAAFVFAAAAAADHRVKAESNGAGCQDVAISATAKAPAIVLAGVMAKMYAEQVAACLVKKEQMEAVPGEVVKIRMAAVPAEARQQVEWDKKCAAPANIGSKFVFNKGKYDMQAADKAVVVAKKCPTVAKCEVAMPLICHSPAICSLNEANAAYNKPGCGKNETAEMYACAGANKAPTACAISSA